MNDSINLVELRPSAEESGNIIIYHPLSNRKFRVYSENLIASILQAGAATSDSRIQALLTTYTQIPGVDEWVQKGWLRSLYYLLSSRGWIKNTVDKKFEKDLRVREINSYIKKSPLPSRLIFSQKYTKLPENVSINGEDRLEIESILNSFGSALEIFIVSYNLDGLKPGIYHYRLEDHSVCSVQLVLP